LRQHLGSSFDPGTVEFDRQGGNAMTGNMFALLVQQRPMTAEEIADERKASEMVQHSPAVAKYLPNGQPFGARGKSNWNTKSLKTVNEWQRKQYAKQRARKRLPDLARSDDMEAYIKARRRAYE
jgi:hypothetical protein